MRNGPTDGMAARACRLIEQPGETERHRAQARAAHRRLLDPQGRRNEIPLIFEAGVGKARDTVILKLIGPVPENASLWYGHGLDPTAT